MDREVSVAVTPELVRKSIYRQFGKLFLITGFLALFSLFNDYIEFSHNGRINWGKHWLILFLVVYTLSFPLVIYKKTIGRMGKMNSPIAYYRIKDDGFYVQTEFVKGKNPWDSFKCIRQYRELWLLKPKSGSYFILPVEKLDEELKQFILNRVPSENEKSQITFKILIGWFLAFIVVMFLAQEFKKPPNVIPPNHVIGIPTVQK